jgi:solute carrier family 9 (sodium/hydrogen exchanger), member 8
MPPLPLRQMQVVMWFAGLRGAIAFALSQSMPGTSKDVYVSTTLMVVLITTLVCGGLTEPMLVKMKVKVKQVSHYEWYIVTQ